MTRLRVDGLTVARIVDRFTVTRKLDGLTVARIVDRFTLTSHSDSISIAKGILALLVSFSLLTTPVWAPPSSSLGTVVYADRAHVGASHASVGATIVAGNSLSTGQSASVQVRVGAARLLPSRARSS